MKNKQIHFSNYNIDFQNRNGLKMILYYRGLKYLIYAFFSLVFLSMFYDSFLKIRVSDFYWTYLAPPKIYN